MMNTKSIHAKIVLSFSIFLFITTGIIFTSFYIVTSQVLFNEVDKELLLHAHNPSQFNNIPGMVITILDQNGVVKQSSISMDMPFVSYKYLFETAQKSTSESFVNQNIGNVPMRFMVKPFIVDGSLTDVLLVAHPIHAIQKSLNILLYTLGVVFVILILPTIFGARLLALRVLKPVSEIADSMNDIGSDNLEKRLINPKTNDVIEKLTVTFNNLLDRLGQSFNRERQFIGDVAHELKTPIATLKSGVEVVLSKKRQKEDYQKALKETLIDVDRMSSLINNILDLAWIGSDKGIINYKVFDLSESLSDLVEIAIKLGGQKNIKVKSNIEAGIKLFGDEGKITRAILNVIDNAIKYTKSNGDVFVSLKKLENNITIEVKDNGVGISKNDMGHVFDRFYRGSKTSKTIGSGLGLSISLGIIQAHNGEVGIKSELGNGTIVKIRLPK